MSNLQEENLFNLTTTDTIWTIWLLQPIWIGTKQKQSKMFKTYQI